MTEINRREFLKYRARLPHSLSLVHCAADRGSVAVRAAIPRPTGPDCQRYPLTLNATTVGRSQPKRIERCKQRWHFRGCRGLRWRCRGRHAMGATVRRSRDADRHSRSQPVLPSTRSRDDHRRGGIQWPQLLEHLNRVRTERTGSWGSSNRWRRPPQLGGRSRATRTGVG